MRVLVVQNYDKTGLGQVGAALAEADADLDIREVHRGEPLPIDASRHAAAVILGGGQNALDDDAYPYIPALLELLRDFERRDRAVLGICLGSQLLARAYGGRNQIGGATEFGWHQVGLTAEAKDDPVLGGLPESFPIFQWHDDTFSLPDGAVRLASSATVANQAFRIGRATYATQFHFEADRALVGEWSTGFADVLATRQPGWAARHQSEAARHGPQADAAGLAIARAWVRLIRA
ncbi:GMP synthase [Mesorhizobium sp. L-8-10]|uniref:type 1 glutamine amidotransferase n=1 Tax=Mesorhizobium sp. L-8-10 TaxID=2744523 RepID=UPI0019286364|nr:type 1 glutamine amidotransferase [Mesorhizobium sp. L-8-10]BCH34594.1 GMP synthase [Mesorhizobium sp. L-8-10]